MIGDIAPVPQQTQALPGIDEAGLSVFPVTQATRATFTGLYFRLTFLFFIQAGSKRVICPRNGELTGEAGDVMIFPAGSVVNMENRPVADADYRAEGVSITRNLVDTVFGDHPARNAAPGIQVLRAVPHHPSDMLALIKETLSREGLPEPLRAHRLLEPLLWLRHHGVELPAGDEEQPWSKVRRLIESDISYPWRLPEVARHFAMSEATFRRWLARSGPGFAQLLLHTRLERGLSLLQGTDLPVSRIALDCGFQTPSHFSDAFRKRFGIKPRQIRQRED